MTARHQTSLDDLLAARGVTGRQLARDVDSTEATVSIWRGLGRTPSPAKRKLIYRALKLTEQEIADLGWEKEPAGV